MKYFKVKAGFAVYFEHSCDCEFCSYDGGYDEDGSLIEGVVAADQEAAFEKVRLAVLDEEPSAKKVSFEIIETFDLPEDKFFLTGDRLYLVDGKYYSDGYVLLESDLVFTIRDVDKEHSILNAFPTELNVPLGRFAKDEVRAYFSECVLNLEWVEALHKIGVSVWLMKGQQETEPLGLEKDGRLVGYVMPMHQSNKQHKFKMINEGPLFSQPVHEVQNAAA